MRSDYNKKKKMYAVFLNKCSLTLMVCMICFCVLSFTGFAAPINSNRVVRVGFFDFEGYHETDQQNRRGGYGYEYLHEMAKYTGWVFEYVDGTWEECQEMLKNGKIDILTSAQYSEARDEIFDYSTTSMGTSYAQLTVASDNLSYGRNDFAQFEGIHIGLLNGNSRNDRLEEFAAEKGFTYRATMYETQQDMDYALKTGAVDAVLTSNLRKLVNESIIAQFAPSPFYAIVKEGNDELLQEINLALEAIEMNNPAFRYTLYQEFYRVDTTDTFVLSREEKEYLATRPTIRAVIRPAVAPISYWENNKFQGISADIMEYLLSDLNIQIEYIYPDSLKESYQMLANGSADIACLFESDYNLGEHYNVRITSPYLITNYSLIFRQQHNQSAQVIQTIAIPDGSVIGTRYAQEHYPHAYYLTVASNDAAIEAVAKKEADFALVNVYSAEKGIAKYSNLRASFISEEEQQFSIGVSQTVDARLYSILDKRINTMDSHVFNDILSRHTMFQQDPISLWMYFQQHPLMFLLIIVVIFTAVISILLYIILNNKRHEKTVYNLAYVDNLTKLWNVNGFVLHGKMLLANNPKIAFVVIAIDIINFSGINDDYGRHIGDKVIERMGSILERFSNERALVAHADGDHFLMLLGYADQGELHTTLTAIVQMLSSYKMDDLLFRFHACLGVGFVEQQDDALLRAVSHAGLARHECSKSRQIVYMDKALQSNLQREKEIRDYVKPGLAQGEFEAYYQPKVDMTTREIIGAEALIRWNHSKLGFLSPAEFLPIVEQQGSITDVDFFVLEQACMLIRKWIDAGQKPIVISVNQSRIHFFKSDYIERLQNIMIKYNIPPHHIELEITETLFGQAAISNAIIKKIKSIGLLISIDDFGSGYSSLHLLHQISVDILKIDKALLDESEKEEKMRNIIRRVIQIAADLEVDVICEGVENKEQMEFLLGIGCKYAQGFLFSKPLPQPEFERMVQNKIIAVKE